MLYLAIPAHNEAATIGVLLWRLRTVLAEFPREYEAVVYDDASSDSTSEILESYQHVMPLTILRGERALGYAGAVNALVRHVARQTRYPRRDAMMLLQGDFTDPPAMIPEFVKRFEGGADLVIGERSATALRLAPIPVKRMQLVSAWMVRLFVKAEGVRDVTSSFRLIRISVLRDLLRTTGDAPVCAGNSQTANADLLLHLIPLARRVETVPVEPTWGVRLRATRVVALKDGLAVASWAWKARGRKAVASTAPETADLPRPNRPARERDREREHSNVLPFEPVELTRSAHGRGVSAGGASPVAPRKQRPPRAGSDSPETDRSDLGAPQDSVLAKPSRRRRPRGARKELLAGAIEATDLTNSDVSPGAAERRTDSLVETRVAGAPADEPANSPHLDPDVPALSPGLRDAAEDAEALFDAQAETAHPLRKRRRRRGSRRGKQPRTDGIDEGAQERGSEEADWQINESDMPTANTTDSQAAEAGSDDSNVDPTGERPEGELRARRRGRRRRRGGSRRNRAGTGDTLSAGAPEDFNQGDFNAGASIESHPGPPTPPAE